MDDKKFIDEINNITSIKELNEFYNANIDVFNSNIALNEVYKIQKEKILQGKVESKEARVTMTKNIRAFDKVKGLSELFSDNIILSVEGIQPSGNTIVFSKKDKSVSICS